MQRFEGFQGRVQGYYYEIFGHANAYDLGATRTINRTITSGSKNLVLNLKAKVFDLGDHWSAETKGWEIIAIDVDTVNTSTSGFSVNEVIDDVPAHSSDNPFTRGRDVGRRWQVKELNVTTVPTPSVITADRTFEGQVRLLTLVFIEIMLKNQIKTALSIKSFMSMKFLETMECLDYDRMTTAGLVIKASRNFNQLDQLRVAVKRHSCQATSS